jgi:endonuclease/exonuclease/phosphatase family metal-dependent hydrolase
MKIISWNLLRLIGASPDEVAALVEREAPDVLLMQEATPAIDRLPHLVGGHYMRRLQPGRVHGLAVWTRSRPVGAPEVVPLPQGAMFRRIGLVVDLGDFAVANVHLSHGQVLNRRQLRRVASVLPERAAVLGDFNLVGPCLLPGFRDVGPRAPTHRCGDVLPLRIDRCLARGLECLSTEVLGRASSDHHPIVVRLAAAASRVSLAA